MHDVQKAARAAENAIAALAFSRLENFDGAGHTDREHVQPGEGF
jgi:hypothetical protein